MTDQGSKQPDTAKIGARLTAIRTESERGISEILTLAENTKTTIESLRRIISNNAQATQLIAELERLNTETLATCSFQDIIRQHIDVTRDLLEGKKSPETADMEENLLAGPRLDGQGLGQKEIDDLLE